MKTDICCPACGSENLERREDGLLRCYECRSLSRFWIEPKHEPRKPHPDTMAGK